MFRYMKQYFAFLLTANMVATTTGAVPDPMLAALAESKASGKGLNLYVNGQAIGVVVVEVTERYIIGKSNAIGTVAIRLDRLDGVAGFLGKPQER